MTVFRGLFLLTFFGAVGVLLIAVRTEQARTGARIEALQSDRVRLRRESWSLQVEISRLRTPERIEERLNRWAIDLHKPKPPSETGDNDRMVSR